VNSAVRLYGEALLAGRGAPNPVVTLSDGERFPLAVSRYLGPADAADRELLDGVSGPVLDVGCGPGRHLHALAARGIFALGVDLSPAAVRLAVGRGGRAIVGDVFDELPGAGTWRTVLLLDGNIGIGGCPARLLARLAALVHPKGELLVELDPPHVRTRRLRARLERDGQASAWFRWARVGAPAVGAVAREGGLRVAEAWCAHDRWFARLRAQDGAP
jgi:SAM-dependent methyltransferase